MYIKTNDYKMSKTELCKLMSIQYLKSRWWVFLVLLLLAVYHRDIMPIFLATGYAMYSVIYSYLYSCSKRNKIFFQKRFTEIDDEFLTGRSEDGSLSKIKLDNFVKVIKTSKYYLLYLSKISFYYIPLRAFLSEEDIKNFDSLLKNKKIKIHSIPK